MLLDEIQELAVARHNEAIVSALRSAITKSRQSERVIFTGSNQDRLRDLFARSRAALYEGTSILGFPALGADFQHFVTAHAQTRFKRRIPSTSSRWHLNGFNVSHAHSSGEQPSFKDVLNERIERLLTSDLFQSVLDQMNPLQKPICRRLVAGGDVSSIDAQRTYAEALGTEGVSPGAISPYGH